MPGAAIAYLQPVSHPDDDDLALEPRKPEKVVGQSDPALAIQFDPCRVSKDHSLVVIQFLRVGIACFELLGEPFKLRRGIHAQAALRADGHIEKKLFTKSRCPGLLIKQPTNICWNRQAVLGIDRMLVDAGEDQVLATQGLVEKDEWDFMGRFPTMQAIT